MNKDINMKRLFQVLSVMIALMSLQSFTSYSKKEDVTVYVCEKGKVYHFKKDCRGLKNAKSKIKAVTLKEAQKTRRACKICN